MKRKAGKPRGNKATTEPLSFRRHFVEWPANARNKKAENEEKRPRASKLSAQQCLCERCTSIPVDLRIAVPFIPTSTEVRSTTLSHFPQNPTVPISRLRFVVADVSHSNRYTILIKAERAEVSPSAFSKSRRTISFRSVELRCIRRIKNPLRS